MSNTQSPLFSVQWIDAAKAAHFHVSLNTDKVFLGLPLLLALGIVILVIEFIHEEECMDTSSSSLTPQIQLTIDLSLWRSR